MANFGLHRRTRQCGELDLLFERASEQQEAGNLLSAFRLFLAAAKAGDVGAQLVLGNFYSDGTGIRRNRKQALYWYKRAYRKGYGPAASNIGLMFREENNIKQALNWYERAARLNETDANLDIARIFLERGDEARARGYLEQVCSAPAGAVTEASREKAQHLLKQRAVTFRKRS